MITLSKFKELTEAEGLQLTDEEAEEARENIYQLLEIAFDVWIKNIRKPVVLPLDNKA
ncbi:MAG: hypothetical protein UY92_C0006G0006 [Candidatus Magasanikbacteria bacterium GW2011_GWA2_56_11]|uniref:Uncharacterized protein n=1 Tax=Candidatus Magasanikbacteria bacterium GW2011_GWA2_56_11 TaxID=1619044 RepID=A0A0G1YGU2_9BACT|nr:MAG: hypothetical protein UY92_C0006G0006 [Candidatus Magasanikbacteria bacterium GW2011_GWA2_56_11]